MNTFTFFLLLIVSILCSNCLCNGNLCIENERVALLQFKHDLVDDANRLSSWSSEYIECCSWAGIVCDNVTGHVHELHLRGHDPEQMLGGNVNPSLVSLKQLKYLDLSSNNFNEIQIPSFIGSLGNLRYLNLSMSQFQGGVPYELGNLSMLVVLDLKNGIWLSNYPVKDL
ncbi:leucine-rich repeat protein [Artemisia annua]|uniref:Leucine-rich repeat protein n=1 Tax=Artemisia annua TaxID=35608 RepID=A0A2U1PCI9_ARTAN|nr:leucine-rich repeat protein [Artemisia annua]